MARNLKPAQRQEAISKIFTALKNCATVEAACAWAGVSAVSFYDWLKKNPGLKKEYEAAIAQSEISLVAEIKKDKAWQSKAWLLERRFPSRWAARRDDDKPKEDKPGGVTRVPMRGQLTDEDRAQAANELEPR